VATAVVTGVLVIGAIGAVQGAGNGDAYDAVKGGAIGSLAGAALSLLLSCSALRRRPGILDR
jgi:high-affinity Fe2+/Pb2+ permease